MRFAFLLLIATVLFANTEAQEKAYKVSKDPKNGSETFSGLVTFADLENEKSFDWLKASYDEYNPDEKVIAFLRENLLQYTIIVFLGTWCSDSWELIPKFEKVLTESKYPVVNVKMYGVDRTKKTKHGESRKYRISQIPTIILFRGDLEAGRITEEVRQNIEKDLMTIIEKDKARKVR